MARVLGTFGQVQFERVGGRGVRRGMVSPGA
jgi:hypothetical protein